jgi:hypothetical protein
VSTTDHEASRAEKLARIEALGIDPWGQRFDGAMPIAQIRTLPAESFDTNPTTRARAARRHLTTQAPIISGATRASQIQPARASM